MGPDRCVWSPTAVTGKEAKRNKYAYKILSIVELGWSIPSCLFILFEIKVDKCFWNDSPKEGFYIQ